MVLINHLAREDETLVFGIDETLERRLGSRINAKGIFRDAVRSTETSHGEGQRTALGQHDVADSHTQCQPLMGAPRAHRTGSIGELPLKDRTTAQEVH